MELQSQHINQRKKLLPLLSRQEQLKQLKEMEYDVLVIGGGATGAGCALDAATRGKNCDYISTRNMNYKIVLIFLRNDNPYFTIFLRN